MRILLPLFVLFAAGASFAQDFDMSRIKYFHKGDLTISETTLSYGDAKVDVVLADGTHRNDWEIKEAWVKSITFSGRTGQRYLNALDDYLKSTLTVDEHRKMVNSGELKLVVKDRLRTAHSEFNCETKTKTCQVYSLDFNFYYGNGLKRLTDLEEQAQRPGFRGYVTDTRFAISIDIEEFEKVLSLANLCDYEYSFGYDDESNTMCLIRFER